MVLLICDNQLNDIDYIAYVTNIFINILFVIKNINLKLSYILM